jgi:CubicO group peptidase (beta-lactamase class C family)
MRLVAVLLTLVIALPSIAQQTSAEIKAVDRIVLNAMRAWDIPGAAVAIVRNDRVIHVAAYGVKEVGGSEPVTIDTLFQIGSASKAFTTTAIAMLADEKKVSWDEPVRNHLDYFRLSDVCADSMVTVRDLAAHRTGLERHDMLWDNSPWQREEVIRRISALELTKPFRNGYQYQNIMFIAAGEVVSQASGTPWDEFVRARIFAPLGMTRSVISDEDWRRSDHATGHRYDIRDGSIAPQRQIETANLGGAGAIKSTARDMANWLRFQLAGGTFDGKVLVTSRQLEETTTPQTVIRLGETTRESNPETSLMAYGLGWFVQDYRGELLVSHSGSLNGFRAHVNLLPKRNTGFVILANAGRSRAVVALRNSLADLLTRKEGRDWNSYYLMIERKAHLRDRDARNERVATRHPNTTPSHPLSAYTGEFENRAYGKLTIAQSGGELVLRWNRFEFPLTHFHYDIFTAESFEDDVDEQIVFETGTTGEVNTLTFFGQRFQKARSQSEPRGGDASELTAQSP